MTAKKTIVNRIPIVGANGGLPLQRDVLDCDSLLDLKSLDAATPDREKLFSDLDEAIGQGEYEALATLLGELEAEEYFAELDAATDDRDKLFADPDEEAVDQEQYEAFVILMAELEAEGFFRELDAVKLSQPRVERRWERQIDRLIQFIATISTKAIACFDSHTTLTAKVSCTLS